MYCGILRDVLCMLGRTDADGVTSQTRCRHVSLQHRFIPTVPVFFSCGSKQSNLRRPSFERRRGFPNTRCKPFLPDGEKALRLDGIEQRCRYSWPLFLAACACLPPHQQPATSNQHAWIPRLPLLPLLPLLVPLSCLAGWMTPFSLRVRSDRCLSSQLGAAV